METAQVADITPSKPKVSLREAASILAALCHRLEDGATPDEAIEAEFSETKLDLAEAIDRRKYVKAQLEATVENARRLAKGFQNQAKVLESAIEALAKNTLKLMLEFPGLPYRDSAGRKVSVVQSNGRLVIDLDLGSKSVTNIVDAAEIHDANIPLEFLEPVSFYRLDSAKVKAALQEGRELPWARVVAEPFLRGL